MKKLQKLDFSKFQFCPARGDIFKMRPAEFMVWCGSNTWASKNRKTSSRCITRPSSGVWGSGFSYQMGVGHIIWSGLHNLIEKKMLYSIWTFPAESVTILSVVGVGSSQPYFVGNNEPFFAGKLGANQWIFRLPTTQISKLFIPALSSAQQP